MLLFIFRCCFDWKVICVIEYCLGGSTMSRSRKKLLSGKYRMRLKGKVQLGC